jgi:hypothetical protein
VLALETPLSEPRSELVRVLAAVEVLLVAVFSFESCVKIVASGFLCNGPGSYLRR